MAARRSGPVRRSCERDERAQTPAGLEQEQQLRQVEGVRTILIVSGSEAGPASPLTAEGRSRCSDTSAHPTSNASGSDKPDRPRTDCPARTPRSSTAPGHTPSPPARSSAPRSSRTRRRIRSHTGHRSHTAAGRTGCWATARRPCRSRSGNRSSRYTPPAPAAVRALRDSAGPSAPAPPRATRTDSRHRSLHPSCTRSPPRRSAPAPAGCTSARPRTCGT